MGQNFPTTIFKITTYLAFMVKVKILDKHFCEYVQIMMSWNKLGTILENEMHQNIGSLNNVIDKVLIHYDENFLEILELILYL